MSVNPSMSPEERDKWLKDHGILDGYALVTTNELLEIQKGLTAANLSMALYKDLSKDTSRFDTLEYLFSRCKIMMKTEEGFPAWYYYKENKMIGPFLDMREMVDNMIIDKKKPQYS